MDHVLFIHRLSVAAWAADASRNFSPVSHSGGTISHTPSHDAVPAGGVTGGPEGVAFFSSSSVRRTPEAGGRGLSGSLELGTGRGCGEASSGARGAHAGSLALAERWSPASLLPHGPGRPADAAPSSPPPAPASGGCLSTSLAWGRGCSLLSEVRCQPWKRKCFKTQTSAGQVWDELACGLGSAPGQRHRWEKRIG